MTHTFDLARTRTSLYSGFVEAALTHGRDKVILEDADGNALTYGRLILASLVLGRRLKKLTRAGENVGVLLPNAVGLPVTLLGLNAYDRVAVVLNFSAGKRALDLRHRHRAIAHRPHFQALRRGRQVRGARSRRSPRPSTLRAPRRASSTSRMCAPALASSTSSPARYGRRSPATSTARPRTKPTSRRSFSSPREPKARPRASSLTNANLLSNIDQARIHLQNVLVPGEILLNPLPIFHSFGLTAGTLHPAVRRREVRALPEPAALPAGAKVHREGQGDADGRYRHIRRRIRARGRARSARQPEVCRFRCREGEGADARSCEAMPAP